MKILLTGATGFLGNNVLRNLLEDGHQVTVALRHTSDFRTIDGLDVETVTIDLQNAAETAPLMEEMDVLVHSAALIQIGWTKMEASLAINATATRYLAEAARRKKVRMIHVSTVDTLASAKQSSPVDESITEPQKPPCAYVASKSKAEELFLEQVALGLDGVIVNPGFMVGPFDWKPSSGEMMLAIANQSLPFAPGGGCSVADVRDVAEGIRSAIFHGRSGERYILGGENMTYLELWTKMANVIGKRPPRFRLPNWLARQAGRFGDAATRFRGVEPQINSAATAMGQLFHYYSSEKAIKELGYQIGSVDTALEDAWNWFKAYGYV